MKKLSKPLALSTETVRSLTVTQLAHVAGGLLASKAESCVPLIASKAESCKAA